ncbi:MAG: hypothetical protein ACI85J_001829 [Candidatus Poriferisodalaceae bacterium]|jgi:hypothetical protein
MRLGTTVAVGILLTLIVVAATVQLIALAL